MYPTQRLPSIRRAYEEVPKANAEPTGQKRKEPAV
jgi:hypothetical protein